jgi:predicted ATPase
LSSLRLAGWKSIRDAKLELRPLNVLIGANGAGKSNLVSFFKLLNDIIARRLQVYVATAGGADALLHYGLKGTPAVEAESCFTTDQGQVTYSFRLIPVAGSNSLVFEAERVQVEHSDGTSGRVRLAGFSETLLQEDNAQIEEKFVHRWLTLCRVFHFHDTSLLGPMRRDCLIDANRFLYPDAANLPAMLYLYRQRYSPAYRRIVAAVKAVAPFFEDFVLEPLRLNPRNIALHWRSTESDYGFGPHQLSDGTLRAIALFTLLLQPEADLPELIVLDEPELGLHPVAIEIVAGMIRAVSPKCQVILATQSTTLLDQFEPEEIVVAEVAGGASQFRRLDRSELSDWLRTYRVSELWQKNVIGGGPLP